MVWPWEPLEVEPEPDEDEPAELPVFWPPEETGFDPVMDEEEAGESWKGPPLIRLKASPKKGRPKTDTAREVNPSSGHWTSFVRLE